MLVVNADNISTSAEGLAAHATHEEHTGSALRLLVPSLDVLDHEVDHFGVDGVKCLGSVQLEFSNAVRVLLHEHLGLRLSGSCREGGSLERLMTGLSELDEIVLQNCRRSRLSSLHKMLVLGLFRFD